MRFCYQPLMLGIEKKRVAKSVEGTPARAGQRTKPHDIWGEGLPCHTIEYEEYPAAVVFKTLQQAPPSNRFWLIRGEPGAGKSTLLAHWFSSWVSAIPAVHFGITVPVLVRLRELELLDLELEPTVLADRLWRCGATLAQAKLGKDTPAIYRLTWGRHFQTVWLLDGLDEVSPKWLNKRLYEALAALPGLKLITCRTAVYAAQREHADVYKEAFRDYLIQGLKPPEQYSFLEHALEGDGEAAGGLQAKIQINAQLSRIASSPLMLTLIAELAGTDRLELPATRAAFYREAIARLWCRKQLPGKDISYLSDLRDRLLSALAEDEAIGLERLEWDMNKLIDLSRSIATVDYQTLIDALERTNLLVIDRHRERVRFYHLTFQEYYLARALQPQGLRAALQRHWNDPRFEETLVLLITLLFEQGRIQEISQDIQWLIAWGQKTYRKGLNVLFGGHCSPLRTVLHLLSRSGVPLSRLTKVQDAIWKAVDRSRLRRIALATDPETPPELLTHLVAILNAPVRKSKSNQQSLLDPIFCRKVNQAEYDVLECIARNPNTPPKLLTRMAIDPQKWIRKMVAKNSNLPSKLYEDLAKDSDEYVREAIAANPSLPEKLYEELVDDPNRYVREALARNPSLPIKLYKRKVYKLLSIEGFSKNPSLPNEIQTYLVPQLLEKLKFTLDHSELISLLKGFSENPNTPQKLLTQILSTVLEKREEFPPDYYWDLTSVIKKVAGNLNTPSKVLVRLADETDKLVLLSEVKTPFYPDALGERLIEDAYSVSDGELGYRWVVETLGGNPNTPPDILRHLANDPELLVRMGVAGNPNTPPDILCHLADAPELLVRMGVAGNPNTPPDTLTLMAFKYHSDRVWAWDRVLEALARNPNTPSEGLAYLTINPHSVVRRTAAKNAMVILEDLWRQDESYWSRLACKFFLIRNRR